MISHAEALQERLGAEFTKSEEFRLFFNDLGYDFCFDEYFIEDWNETLRKEIKKIEIINEYSDFKIFLIKIDKECNLIRVAYCTFAELGNNPIHDMKAEVTGKTAIEIVNTLIKEDYISTLQHSADMGIELHKAQLALKYNLEYTQDKEIII